jgi:hypothetical protein
VNIALPLLLLQMLEAVALEAGLADLARQALSTDPEAAAQLKRYEAAVVRLEKAKAAEKELENIMKVRAGLDHERVFVIASSIQPFCEAPTLPSRTPPTHPPNHHTHP